MNAQLRLPQRGSWWQAWSWLVLAVALVAGYGLAVAYGNGSFGQRLIDALKLFPGFPGYEAGRPWQYVLARHLAALIALLVTARVVLALLGDRIAQFRARLRRGHVVVCGLGETGLRSTRAFRAAGYRVTCLELAARSDAVTEARRLGALVLRRDATEVGALQTARADQAAVVVCACTDDATNTKIASFVVALANMRTGSAPSIHVELENPDLARLLRAPLASVGPTRLHFFSLSTVWARALLDAAGPSQQVVVLGATKLAQALVVEAAHRRHAHVREHGSAGRATLTLIAPAADEICSELVERYPAIARVCDLVPFAHPLGSSNGLMRGVAGSGGAPPVVFACIEDQSVNLAYALEAANALVDESRVLLPATAAAAALGPLLAGRRIAAVELPEDAASIDLLHDQMRDTLARETHEHHLAERRHALDFGARLSDRPWAELGRDARVSSYAYVDAMIEQLHAVWTRIEPLYDWDEEPMQLTDDAVEAMAELEHARWCRERLAAGWEHAAARNDAEKHHDLLLEWSDLPEEARRTGREMVRDRPRILAHAGFRLEPDPARELLARILHDRYVQARTGSESAPLAVPWAELDETARDYNRASVDHIAVKLARIGCTVAPRATGAEAVDLTDDDVERMAQTEHSRWVRERVLAGWSAGDRDDELRSHPGLVPWSALSEAEREKDRDVVRLIPALLAERGYVAVRASA
jgi:voltage-gated potassium channel Kch